MTRRPRSKQRRTGQKNIGSDISIAVASDWAPIRALEPIAGSASGSVYGDTLAILRSADLRIVNCECALTRARKPVWKSGAVFKGLPAHVKGLTSVPFDVACLANNHVFDYGVSGFRETLSVLGRSGIRTVGAGLTEAQAMAPLTVPLKSRKISILNFSEGEDLTASRGGPGVCGWEIDRLCDTVRNLKKRGDFVIAIGHAGLEYIPFPPPYVIAAFRELSDAGADAVVGHHPHVPQGLEVRRGRLIAYSLGNFVFYQLSDLYYRKTGFFLEIRIRGNEMVSFEPHPFRITEKGIRRLGRGEEAAFRKKLNTISGPLASARGGSDAWQAYLAYYGPMGFKKEVLGILETMGSDPRKGAAMFRNRITTLQHSELWRDALTRIMSEKSSPVRPDLTRIIREWFTKPVPGGAA